MSTRFREYLSEIGKKGGQSRSKKKVAAARENIKKATADRIKKQKRGRRRK